jgi:hypothetical protein
MKSGYKIFWSNTAIQDLKNLIDYLTLHWTNKEIRQFARKLDKRIEIITINPMLFPSTTKKKNIRRSVFNKTNRNLLRNVCTCSHDSYFV